MCSDFLDTSHKSGIGKYLDMSSPKHNLSLDYSDRGSRIAVQDLPLAILEDETYLLRRCSRYDWGSVQLCCNALIKVLRHQDSTQGNGKVTSDAVKQLLATDPCGNTPLHEACRHRPPLPIIVSMLEAASLAPSGPINIHLIENQTKSTPLVIACSNGACLQVIQLLLFPPPSGLMEAGVHALSSDDHGETAFSGLLEYYEKMMRMIEGTKSSSLDHDDAKVPLKTTSIQETSTPEYFHSWLLDSVESIIRAFWSSTGESDLLSEETCCDSLFLSLVHGAASVCEFLPLRLTDLLLQQDSTVLTATNRMATLSPLHLAVLTDASRLGARISRHRKHVVQRKHFIEALLKVDPSAARKQFPGSSQRTPFCQAVASGLPWHITPEKMRDKGNEKGPLQSLLKSAPEAMYGRDKVTGLPPTLLAATVAFKQDPISVTEPSDASHLDTVYSLLRLHPQVIQESMETICDREMIKDL